MLALTASNAHAQELPDDEIIVTATRETLDTQPLRVVNEEEASTYGLGTIGELLDELAAEEGNSSTPVLLINGRRVGGLGDIDSYPVEALAGVDILPPGTAARLGEAADRRVYNVRLKPQARVLVAQLDGSFATGGSWSSRTAQASATFISHPRRINISARSYGQDSLLESDRAIIQPASSSENLGRNRTLRPSVDGTELELTAFDQLANWLDGSLSGEWVSANRFSLRGISADGDQLEQYVETDRRNVSVQMNANLAGWLLSFDASYNEQQISTLTDNFESSDGQSFERTHSRASYIGSEVNANGPLLDLPAGSLRLSLGAGVSRDLISSQNLAMPTESFSQTTRHVSAGIDIPLASRMADVLPFLGELSANFRINSNDVSDIGVLTNPAYSLRWQPAPWLNLFGQITVGRTPPDVSFLRAPLLQTPGVRYYDPIRDETVDVLQISGGNPDLGVQQSEGRYISVALNPLGGTDLQLRGEYTSSNNRDITTVLPPLSSLLSSAFPDRFVRTSAGTLVSVDIRPVRFTRRDEEQVRYGFNLNLPLGGERNSDEMRGRQRLQITAFHTWLLKSELQLRSDFDPVDLLSPNAIGLQADGRPRHRVEFTVGYSERGFGVRLTGEHRSASLLSLGSGESGQLLRFTSLTKADLRAYIEGSRLVPRSTLFENSRLSLLVENITNARQEVLDRRGATPLAFQSAYRDPIGRTVTIEFRRTF